MRLLRLARICPPWGALDTIGHALHVPWWLLRPFCDRFERALGA